MTRIVGRGNKTRLSHFLGEFFPKQSDYVVIRMLLSVHPTVCKDLLRLSKGPNSSFYSTTSLN